MIRYNHMSLLVNLILNLTDKIRFQSYSFKKLFFGDYKTIILGGFVRKQYHLHKVVIFVNEVFNIHKKYLNKASLISVYKNKIVSNKQ